MDMENTLLWCTSGHEKIDCVYGRRAFHFLLHARTRVTGFFWAESTQALSSSVQRLQSFTMFFDCWGKCCFWSPVKSYYSSCLSSCLVLCAQSYFSGYMTNITLWSWVSAYISPMETALSFLIALADTSINVSASAFFSLDLQKARAMHYAELFMD